ncbi:MAG: NAD(P)H-dependent glycerol-3-phosphate dehydrogenase [Bacteroidia bacterium]|nr:NAD(P)H-dependent glycerol-3-phosphate dehydrogenase [Bacteroidia bacterium]
MVQSVSKHIAVIGGGSWGTALVKILSDNLTLNDPPLNWWVRGEDNASYINQYHHNPKYLSSVQINSGKVKVSSDLMHTIASSDMLLFAIPSAFLADSLKEANGNMLQNKIVISAIKGIVPQTSNLVAEYFHNSFGVPYPDMLVISGPCHAEEVALEKLSFLTIAGQNKDYVQQFASMLAGRFIKTVASDDIFGTEYAAVLKNIYALANGICHGLGYGDNFQAVLIANSIKEIERFLDKIFPTHREVTDSAYLGDLLVTAYSQFSRNRTFGNMIGKGYSVQAAQLEMNMIAEGYYAVKSMHELNKQYQVNMPIMEAVYKILYRGASASDEIRTLIPSLS